MADKHDLENAPDPDEDDLSDLDDMLDEFSAAKIDEPKAAPSDPASSAASKPKIGDGSGVTEDDFAKQLQAGMAELIGELDTNPEMKQEFEKMLKDLGQAAESEGGPAVPIESTTPNTKPTGERSAAAPKPGEDSFQETIRKTMERMQNSGDSASAAAASSNEEDMLAKMLKEMESGNFPGLEGGSEEDFNKMLMGMMEQLTNKDILYEPMKELQEKFPGWLESHGDSVTKEDLARYKEQQATVTKIVQRFERPGYTDSNQEDRSFIVDQMQKMQAAGSPPPDLVGEMGSAQDMLSDMDGGCPQQ